MVSKTSPELQGAQPRVASIIVVSPSHGHGASSSSCNGSLADAGHDADTFGVGWQFVCSQRSPCLLTPPASASTLRPYPLGCTGDVVDASSWVTVLWFAGIPSGAPTSSNPATVPADAPMRGTRSAPSRSCCGLVQLPPWLP
ncbi:hypothetical protein D1007_12569 [Hordeum vulgare]|nr:hypothetical protein D1007_12569 [Hordeum vulgare]KAI4974791.1 hypothetical protein ZWY2020_048398 [Hordeum vulgare]